MNDDATAAGASPGTTANPENGQGPDGRDVDAGDSPSRVTGLAAMPPRERLVEVIEREGGWMWQDDLVDAVALSSSTVSRHLSSLEENGEVGRVPVGREKLVGVPDVEVDVLESIRKRDDGE